MNVKLITVFCMMFSLCCCAQKPNFTSFSPAEFEQLLKESSDVQLVDVRRPEEFAAGHIADALLINVMSEDFIKKAESLLDKSKPVAVYCRSGKRSKDAAGKLTKKGFVVYDLDTGYIGWVAYLQTK